MRLMLLLFTLGMLQAVFHPDPYPQTSRALLLQGAADRARVMLGAAAAAALSLPVRASSSSGGPQREVRAESPLLDYQMVRACVDSNRVFQHLNFINASAVRDIESSILSAYGDKFAPSGLSNRRRASGDQGFSPRRDRSVAPFNPKLMDTPETLLALHTTMQQVRRELSAALGRPSMARDDLAHEAYFSRSCAGASLPRHLDERSESLKGRLGYLTSSRRSISWLLYVHSCEWGAENGGELRTYPQAGRSMSSSVVGLGRDVQVGWLGRGRGLYPVFLAIRPSLEEGEGDLYIVKGGFYREVISHPISLVTVNSAGFSAFASRLLPGITATDTPSPGSSSSSELWAIEDAALWDRGGLPAGAEPSDVIPASGSLLLFDSISLPHEVLPVKKGTRLAAAGWFHEGV